MPIPRAARKSSSRSLFARAYRRLTGSTDSLGALKNGQKATATVR